MSAELGGTTREGEVEWEGSEVFKGHSPAKYITCLNTFLENF